MKRILLATKNQNDTTAFLRAMGPFTEKSLRHLVLPITPPAGFNWVHDWTHFYDVDCVYIHRPYTVMDQYIMEKTKLLGVPLWVDHDDDLEHVPPQNPHHVHFKDTSVIKLSFELADILTFGSDLYLDFVKETYHFEGLHIANALDDRLLKFKKPFGLYGKRVAWRGSESHMSDLLFFQDEINEVLERYQEKFCYHFFGINPFWLKARYSFQSQMNLFEYYQEITNYNAHVHWVPLEDNFFNRVKSNLSWLDATLAGSAVLAPNFPEFRHPGVSLYEAGIKRDFYREFNGMFNRSIDELKRMHDFSWEYIRDTLLLSKVNQTRRDIINDL